MKGFLGAFLIFTIWASGSIYYLHLKEDRVVLSNPNEADISQETVSKEVSEASSRTASESISAALDSLPSPSTDIEMAAKVNDITDVDSLGVQSDTPLNSALSNAHLLAAEIKKTIAISDTIDIDRDEPEQSPNDVIAVSTGPSVSSELFYPQYTNTDLVLDKRLVAYASQLKEMIKQHPEKKITIIGHTDNVGNAQDNFKIALKKARQIKWYLTARRGISRSKITATSRGEEEPIENNTSAWGRKKNNRIEIIID